MKIELHGRQLTIFAENSVEALALEHIRVPPCEKCGNEAFDPSLIIDVTEAYNAKLPEVGVERLVKPLPVLRDQRGQVIREFDILRVFHFYGRRRGKGREKHYMYKIATVKPLKNPRFPRVWWFHHTAEMGEGLTNGYIPYNKVGAEWGTDETLEGVEVIDSPATLHDKVEAMRVDRPNAEASGPDAKVGFAGPGGCENSGDES